MTDKNRKRKIGKKPQKDFSRRRGSQPRKKSS